MASSPDNEPLDGEHRVVERRAPALTEGPIERICRALCAFAILAMIIMIACEVFLRGFFGKSLQSVDELGGYLLVGISFLSLSTCLVRGSFHKVEFLDARLSDFGLALRQLIFDCICLVFCTILLWQLGRLVLRSWNSGDLASTILQTPLWIPQLTMPIGAAALCYSLVKIVWIDMRRLGTLSQFEV